MPKFVLRTTQAISQLTAPLLLAVLYFAVITPVAIFLHLIERHHIRPRMEVREK